MSATAILDSVNLQDVVGNTLKGWLKFKTVEGAVLVLK